MGTFRDDLHELCKREMQNAIGSEDAAANMTTELVSQLSSTIALVTCGNGLAWRPAVQHIVKSLPQQVFEKAKAVRDGYAEMTKEAGK